eukprot:6078307-Amphidinium_carterae.1
MRTNKQSLRFAAAKIKNRSHVGSRLWPWAICAAVSKPGHQIRQRVTSKRARYGKMGQLDTLGTILNVPSAIIQPLGGLPPLKSVKKASN